MSVVYVLQSAWCIFTQPYFSVNLFRQAVREQTPGRTLLCLQQRSHTFSTVYSIQRCPSKDAGWERLVNMCTVNRLIFQHCQSSAAHHTHTHSHTSHAGTYGKPRVSEQRRFKAWPANTFICFFPPLCVWVSDWPADTPTQTYTFQLLLFCPSYSIPVSERVNEHVQGCNCYHLEKET